MLTSNPALSTVADVVAVADQFFGIADLLHRRLSGSPIGHGQDKHSTDLYGLLVEEYGLRTRAGILRNDAATHVVGNAVVEQEQLVKVLAEAGAVLTGLAHLSQIRSLIAVVSALCVGISPGKGRIVDFLAKELDSDLQEFRKA